MCACIKIECSSKYNLYSIITLLEVPKKKEVPGSGIGLKANDEVLISSKRLSLLLSGASGINVKLLPSTFETNGNFPVVGDGCACSLTGSEGHIRQSNINRTSILPSM